MAEGESFYVDTPRGIFTASGIWFHITEKRLQDYAGAVLDEIPLKVLIGRAEVWLQSGKTLALWLLPVLLFLFDPIIAVLGTITAYVLWEIAGPSLVSGPPLRVFRLLEKVLLQGLYYVFALSVLAADGTAEPVIVGIVGFILLRWDLLPRLVKSLTGPVQRRLYPMEVSDHVLRLVVIRAALKLKIPLAEIQEMERRMMDRFSRK